MELPNVNVIRRFWNWLTAKNKPIICEDILVAPTPEAPEPPTPQPPTADQVYDQILKERAEAEKHHWTPKPTAKRRRITSHSHVPAAKHADAIAKHMKGKGRFHKTYRRMIKTHTSKEELEQN